MLLLEQMLILFLVMLTGFIARKREIIDAHAAKKLSSIVVNIANPAMVISGVLGGSSISKPQFFYTMAIAVGVYVVLLILAAFIPKVLRIKEYSQKGVYQLMLVFSNIGFLGFPVISAAYGTEALLYATLFILPYNVLIYTYGIVVLQSSSGQETKLDLKHNLKRILNIGVIACLIAIAIYLLDIRVPALLASTIDMLGGLTAPLSMLVIGTSFYGMDFKGLFTDVRLLFFSAIKLLLIPVVSALIMKQFTADPMLLGVCVIILSTPVGSLTAMLAQEYGGDTVLTSRGVAITTLLSVATIPLVSMICGI